MFVPIINCLVTPVISSWFFGMAWMFFKYENKHLSYYKYEETIKDINDEIYKCTKRMEQKTERQND